MSELPRNSEALVPAGLFASPASSLLVALSDQTSYDDVIRAVGACVGSATSAVDQIHAYIVWLRSKHYRIREEDLPHVESLLKQSYSASDEVLRGYARTFRSLLSVETLPLKFSITNSVHVQSYELHDEVDCLFDMKVQKDGRSTTESVWLYGLVVNKRAATTKDAYQVFWIGSKPCASGLNINPQWVSVHIMRRHIAGTAAGTEQEWMDVEELKSFRIEDYKPKPKPKPQPDPSALKPRPKPPPPKPQPEPSALKPHPRPPPPKPKATRNTPKPTPAKPANSKSDTSSAGDDEESPDGSEDDAASTSVSEDATESCDDDEEEEEGGGNRYQDMQHVFHDVQEAIATLVALHSGLPVHPETLFDDLAAKLTRISEFQAVSYSNSAYVTLVTDTLAELRRYEGQENPKLPHTSKFLQAFSKFGFCITPRLWKKEEILCIAIVILDPRLQFTGILQKDGKAVDTSYRGMALLHPMVQRVFYERLRSYGFVNPRYHPEKLQSFSSVVINGGGSWQQNATWHFPVTSRFQMNPEASPFMVKVGTDGVGALEANGLYVATTTLKNGHCVYVQVCKEEFDGWKEPGGGSKQPGFKTCLNPGNQNSIRQCCRSLNGNRKELCSPRVLTCIDTSKWGIQLLPAYGSDFFICEFEWKKGSCSVNANVFKSLDFETFKAELQPCCVNLEVMSNDCILSDRMHSFSFGPFKIAKCHLPEKKKQKAPCPLRPQGFHSDGPLRFNKQVLDFYGKLKRTAPSCTKKKKGVWIDMWDNPLTEFLPEHISIMQEAFSALFGIFSGTYIQTPASGGRRMDSVLNVDVPLGCAIVFTFAWKHRGKGDDGHKVTEKAPVAVHARPHFYIFNTDLRRLPSFDFEACLEFLSICAQKQPGDGSGFDDGSGLFALDTLQTFDGNVLGHEEPFEVHEFFSSQNSLNKYVDTQLDEQRKNKNVVVTNCNDWMLNGRWSSDGKASGMHLELCYRNGAKDACVDVVSACFDSEQPAFFDSKGQKYNLVGKSVRLTEFPANTPDAIEFKSQFQDVLLPLAQQYMDDMVDRWQQSKLLSLLAVLNALVLLNSDVPFDDSEGTNLGFSVSDSKGDALHGYLPSDEPVGNALKGFLYRPDQHINIETTIYHDVSETYKHVYFIENSICIIVLSELPSAVTPSDSLGKRTRE
jgi:hypothetical protein